MILVIGYGWGWEWVAAHAHLMMPLAAPSTLASLTEPRKRGLIDFFEVKRCFAEKDVESRRGKRLRVYTQRLTHIPVPFEHRSLIGGVSYLVQYDISLPAGLAVSDAGGDEYHRYRALLRSVLSCFPVTISPRPIPDVYWLYPPPANIGADELTNRL